ncbi:MAG: TY-Chap domain-containing protein [Nocardioidaceae bacterium]
MESFGSRGLEESIERAWSSFRRRLADYAAGMADGDTLTVEVASAECESGSWPFARFTAWGRDRLRGEVSGNGVLRGSRALDATMMRTMLQIGWISSTPELVDAEPNFSIDLTRAYADRLAVMTVEAFRRVWGVVHPGFMVASDRFSFAATTRLGIAAPREAPCAPSAPDGADVPPEPVAAETSPDLARQIRAALASHFGHEPTRSDSDSFIVSVGRGPVLVRRHEVRPVVEVVAPIVRGVAAGPRTDEVILQLNLAYPLIKVFLIVDTVLAVGQIPAAPFVAAHLAQALTALSELVNGPGDELACFLDSDEPITEPTPPAPRRRRPRVEQAGLFPAPGEQTLFDGSAD